MRLARMLMLTLLLAGPAWAGQEVVDAERARLSDEMEKLVQRQVWAGVERKYQELERLGSPLSVDDYLHGATAARELGDVASSYDRLKAAARIKGTKEIVDWLWDIDNNYGHVELVSVPARSTALEPQLMPFDPNQRKAVDAAIDASRQDGAFMGMLPRGDYRFGGQSFGVEPGISVRIEVSPRMRRQGLIDPVIVYRELPGAVSAPPASAPSPSPDAGGDGGSQPDP